MDRLPTLRVDDLRFLIAVASTGRVVAAADRLQVDHSTVSRRLRALEKSLGVSLIERGASGWELTEVGRAVAERAQPVESLLDDVVRVARGGSSDEPGGVVRLSAPEGFAAIFAVPAMARLQERYPAMTVEILTATRQLNLQPAGFDLAVAVGTPTTNRLIVDHLCTYDLGLYASEEYLAAHPAPRSLADLRDHTVVFYVDSMLQVGDLDLQHYVPTTSRFSITSVFAQLAATVEGAGIGLLPRFMALREPALREIDLSTAGPSLSFSLAARPESLRRPIVDLVRRALRGEVEQRRAELTA